MKEQRIQEIILENGMKVYINHNAKDKCKECGKEIVWASIPLELVGLAKWDLHLSNGHKNFEKKEKLKK